jgi:hypothetical protein
MPCRFDCHDEYSTPTLSTRDGCRPPSLTLTLVRQAKRGASCAMKVRALQSKSQTATTECCADDS